MLENETRWFWRFLLLAALCFSVLARLVPAWGTAEQEEGFRLFGVDSHYHLRFVERIATEFPRVDRMDADAGYPEVVRSDAVGFYQWTLGGIAKLLDADRSAIVLILALSGPLFAVLVTLLLARIGVMIFGWGVGILLTWLFVLLPGRFFDRPVFGFADHHALEVVCELGIIGALLLLADRPRSKLGQAEAVFWSVLLVVSWKGAPLSLSLIGLAFGVGSLVRMVFRADVSAWLGSLVRVSIGVFVVLLLIGLVAPGILPDVNSWRISVSLAGLSGLSAGLARFSIHRGLGARWVGLVGGFAALLFPVVGYLVSPAVRYWYGYAFSAKSTSVQEHLGFSPEVFQMTYGLLGWVAGLGLLLAILRFRRLSPQGQLLFPVVAAFFVLWMLTGDYGYKTTPVLALMAGYSLGLAKVLLEKLSQNRLQEKLFCWGAGCALLAAAVSGMYPFGKTAGVFRPMVFYDNFLYHTDPWRDALSWLGGHPSIQERGRGVWTHWPYGNLVPAYTEFAAVHSRYPSGERLGPLLRSERKAIESSINGAPFDDAVRFVIVDAALASSDLLTEVQHLDLEPQTMLEMVSFRSNDGRIRFLPRLGGEFQDTLLARLFAYDGTGLKHFRLAWESSDFAEVHYEVDRGLFGVKSRIGERGEPGKPVRQGEYGHAEVPAIKIYERVPGAVIRYEDSDVVSASATLVLENIETGHRITYRQSAESTPEGFFVFHLPYSQNPPPFFGVHPTGPYRLRALRADGKVVETEFSLPEEAVVEGRQIRMEGKWTRARP